MTTTKQEMEAFDKTLSDAEKMDMLHILRESAGWAGTMFAFGDVEDYWNQDEDIVDVHGEFSDDHWAKFQNTWAWRRGVEERACEVGWDVISDGISDVVESINQQKGHQ